MGFYNTAGVESIKATKGSRNIKSIGLDKNTKPISIPL
jgi:hypothetical protein